jgi:hypothetical protein
MGGDGHELADPCRMDSSGPHRNSSEGPPVGPDRYRWALAARWVGAGGTVTAPPGMTFPFPDSLWDDGNGNVFGNDYAPGSP